MCMCVYMYIVYDVCYNYCGLIGNDNEKPSTLPLQLHVQHACFTHADSEEHMCWLHDIVVVTKIV